MKDYAQARDFKRDYYALWNFPKPGQRGIQFVEASYEIFLRRRELDAEKRSSLKTKRICSNAVSVVEREERIE